MTATETVENYLDSNKVQFVHRKHEAAATAHQVAVKEHIPDHEVAKTVVFHAGSGFGMAVLPADCDIDFMELCNKLGTAKVRLATEEELAAIFPDSETGAMPPFGNLYAIPVFLDRRLAEDAVVIAFNAGTHRDVIYIGTEDYRRLVNPFVLSFSRCKAS